MEEVPDWVFDRAMSYPLSPPFSCDDKDYLFTQVDLFAGIGGIRLGFQRCGGRTVFSSEIDKFASKTYAANYGEVPFGDITTIDPYEIPDHDILLAGFPCQPFSQAGLKRGFEDTRGTLFFNIASILQAKRPKAFMLENVKQLRTHDKGRTLAIILQTLRELNYYVPEPQILNANDFGVPQNRERIFIVGFNKDYIRNKTIEFSYPIGSLSESVRVGDILEDNVPERFTVSEKLYQGHLLRKEKHKKKGNGFGFCVFRANSKRTNTISARYYKDGSEALIEQEGTRPRMLTPRECARLQGFPEDFIIPVSNAQAYKQFGNSVCVNVVEAIAQQMVAYLQKVDSV